jgi:S-methylmethionine-dependent homocysteine/selenocysteine methylase
MAVESWGWVTDGGLETDLIFHHAVDLPEFAAYPLVRSSEGRALLRDYYGGYARIAETVGCGVRLETPTWRASSDWGERLGDCERDLDEVNRAAVELVQQLRETWRPRVTEVLVVGTVGPRYDGHDPAHAMTPDQAAHYHAPQLRAFADAGADEACALTLTDADEAIGVVRAADSAGIPVIVSFTVETDGRLPDGSTLADAVRRVDAEAPPASFMVNCAHPLHVLPALDAAGPWVERITGMRANASTASHAELDEADTLDEGNIDVLVSAHRALEERLPALEIVGGCCGTDTRHVAALWDLTE